MIINIIFSSLTGNTKQVAYEILKSLPENTAIYDLKELAQMPEGDVFVLGYWVDRAKPNQEMYQFMETLRGRKVLTFGTLGAYPDSEHAKETKENTHRLLEKNNQVLGHFLCQGKIDPKLTEMFKKNAGGHAMTPERLKRHEDAAKHPNEEDFINARKFIETLLNHL